MDKKKNVLMLAGDLHKLFKCHIKNVAEKNNINECYRLIVFFLAHNEGITQLDLVKYTRLKAPTISLTLQKMELEGLVERRTSEDDARKTLVYLTKKGYEYDQKMIDMIKNEERKILPALTEEENAQLEELLQKLIKFCNNIQKKLKLLLLEDFWKQVFLTK